jgi:hypothetical protein
LAEAAKDARLLSAFWRIHSTIQRSVSTMDPLIGAMLD